MNKREFLEKLSHELSYSLEMCVIINDILENNFFISKQNKGKIVDELIEKLNIDKLEAEKIYDVATKVLRDGIKDKLKHPFRSID